MTTLSQLQSLQSVLDSQWFLDDRPALIDTIEASLAVAPPDGSPEAISAQANAYLQAGSTCQHAAGELSDVAQNKLPSAWRGDVADTATQAVTALTAEANAANQVLSQAGQALLSWAGDLQKARADDQSGRGVLRTALRNLEPTSSAGFIYFQTALGDARRGIASMVSAASLVQDSGDATATTLSQLAGQAMAERVDASGLDPLDAVVLANEMIASSDGGGNILTAAEMARASQLMNGMSAANLAKFEKLLADAKSPAEAAFLMKALAACNSLAAVQQFDALIHPYGSNLAWLSKHLAPDLTEGKYNGQLWYQGPSKPGGGGPNQTWSIYAQTNAGDCVAASTVAAMANLDPVFMLKLTTGNQPWVPGSDSVSAFVHRLQGSYISQYQAGQRADFMSGEPTQPLRDALYPQADKGLTPGGAGENMLTNTDLGKATGLHYNYVSLNGTGDNQAVLPAIEKAVGAGQPVPIDVDKTSGLFNLDHQDGHHLVIIGASSGQFTVYDSVSGATWGVPVQDFVNNQMTQAFQGVGVAPDVSGVELPST